FGTNMVRNIIGVLAKKGGPPSRRNVATSTTVPLLKRGGKPMSPNMARTISLRWVKKVVIQLKSGIPLISIVVSVRWVAPLNATRKQRKILRCKNRHLQPFANGLEVPVLTSWQPALGL